MTSSENMTVSSDDKYSVVINDMLLQTAHLLFTMITLTDLLLEILCHFLKQWVFHFIEVGKSSALAS